MNHLRYIFHQLYIVWTTTRQVFDQWYKQPSDKFLSNGINNLQISFWAIAYCVHHLKFPPMLRATLRERFSRAHLLQKIHTLLPSMWNNYWIIQGTYLMPVTTERWKNQQANLHLNFYSGLRRAAYIWRGYQSDTDLASHQSIESEFQANTT